jgi:serine/threonine protein kinase/Tol biopolymer transport system component
MEEIADRHWRSTSGTWFDSMVLTDRFHVRSHGYNSRKRQAVTLAPGVRLGPYAILSSLGAGGMGEVYKARDTRLDRTVAIKVLPSHVAESPDARQRFDREARAISALQHPHICTLYDVGHQDGIHFLVMEYLEGEALADQLAKGALLLNQVLQYATEITDALEKAHRAGIVHCDLKPANIMLTKTGAKLLDFGLASLNRHNPQRGHFGVGQLAAETGALGDEHVLMGTVPYMAPEQLDGRSPDARADIFACGVILYEMLTGRKPFEAIGVGSSIAAILSTDPQPPTALHPTIPPTLDRVVLTCLAKDPDDRWQTASDLNRALHWIAADLATSATPAQVLPWRPDFRSHWLAWGIVSLIVIGAIALSAVSLRRRPSDVRLIQFLVAAPDGTALSSSAALLSVSPDGQQIAFVASTGGGPTRIWVRSLDSVKTRELPGTDNALSPFWAPDARSVGFFANDKLKIVDVTGGLPRVVCDAPIPYQVGTWSRDGDILFSAARDRSRPCPSASPSAIYRVSAVRGTVIPVRTAAGPACKAFSAPEFLPDGRHFIYQLETGEAPEAVGIYVGSLDASEDKLLVNTRSNGFYAAPGYLFFRRGDTLFAQRFDTAKLALSGQPSAVAQNVAYNPTNGRTIVSVSEQTLAYRQAADRQLVWFDRVGRQVGMVATGGTVLDPALSPDESRLAVTRQDPATGMQDIWLIHLRRGVSSRMTFSSVGARSPVWSPDGRRIVFQSSQNRGTEDGLFETEASGAGQSRFLAGFGRPSDWSADGRFILYSIAGGVKLFVLPLSGNEALRPFELPFTASTTGWPRARLSPDGRWIAYTSTESGTDHVFVRAFPKGEFKLQVSSQGGSDPLWRSDGKELVYLSADGHIMAVPILARQETLEMGSPTPLFATNLEGRALGILGTSQYVMTRDGQRFLVNQPAQRGFSITVVANWSAAVNR